MATSAQSPLPPSLKGPQYLHRPRCCGVPSPAATTATLAPPQPLLARPPARGAHQRRRGPLTCCSKGSGRGFGWRRGSSGSSRTRGAALGAASRCGDAKDDKGEEEELQDATGKAWVARVVAVAVASVCVLLAAASDLGLLVLPLLQPGAGAGAVEAAAAQGSSSRSLGLGLVAPMAAAAASTALAGVAGVPLLRRLKASQTVRSNGPESHLSKAGTPTAGGVFVVPCGLLVGAVAAAAAGGGGDVVVAVAGTAALGGVGLADDLLKVSKRSSGGLTAKQKILAQTAVAVLVGLYAAAVQQTAHPHLGSLIRVPLVAGAAFLLSPVSYVALSAFTVVAESNGANLADGLDGLAAGTGALALTALAVALAPGSPALGALAASMGGACLGFLPHNCHVARCFMGDTGSLAIGGLLGILGALSGAFLPLLAATGVFAAEAASVILQVAYFRFTRATTGKGRRLLRMAPLHHHLELGGWHETSVTALFCAAGSCLAALAVLAAAQAAG